MSIKCSHCKEPTPEYGAILLTCDGDFACSFKCEQAWKAERDHFFSIISDDTKYNAWMTGT